MININQNISKTQLVKDTLHKCFSDLVFDEELHKYTLHGDELTSTTTWIKKYCHDFIEYKQAVRLAKRVNKKVTSSKYRSYKYYQKRWQRQRDAATLSGSRVHDYVEYNYPDFIDPPACEQEKAAKEFILGLEPHYKVVALELRMYIKEFKKAGTADIIIYNTNTGNLVLADWKTNGTNIRQHYIKQRLKKPFDFLFDNDINKYSLQLSDYQNMIEMNTNYKVEERWIIHLTSNDVNTLDISKEGRSDIYTIDNTIQPVINKAHYKVYKLPDYSNLLKQQYSNG